MLALAVVVFCAKTDKTTRKSIRVLRTLAAAYLYLIVAGFILYGLLSFAWPHRETIAYGFLSLPVYLLGGVFNFFSNVQWLLLLIVLLLYGIY